jgi:hypothetical protein
MGREGKFFDDPKEAIQQNTMENAKKVLKTASSHISFTFVTPQKYKIL